MHILRKSTGAVITPSEAQAIEDAAFSGTILGFSEEGLLGTDYAVINTPDQPSFDSRYLSAQLTNITLEGGSYAADWELVPSGTISELATKKVEEINLACSKSICDGFYSIALGALHRYSSDTTDQLNLQGNIIAATQGRDCYHICYTSTGERVVALHTPAQMFLVGDDLSVHIWQNIGKANQLKMLIAESVADESVDDLLVISWDM